LGQNDPGRWVTLTLFRQLWRAIALIQIPPDHQDPQVFGTSKYIDPIQRDVAIIYMPIPMFIIDAGANNKAFN